MKKNLTLNVDAEVIAEARRLAEQDGTSVSALFSQFVLLLAKRRSAPPAVGRLGTAATGLVNLPHGVNEREILENALLEKHG